MKQPFQGGCFIAVMYVYHDVNIFVKKDLCDSSFEMVQPKLTVILTAITHWSVCLFEINCSV